MEKTLSKQELIEKNKRDAELLVKRYHEQIYGGVIDDIYDKLVLDKKVRPTISERHFVAVYLPIFTSRVAQGMDNPYHLGISTWVNDIARSHFNSVDVIDDSGKVLFTVPPLADSRIIKSKYRERRGLSKAVNTHLLMEGKVPMEVLTRTKNEDYYNAAGAMTDGDVQNDEYREAWLNIFRRYNVLPKEEVEKEEKSANEAASAEKISSSDMDFDDDF